MKYKVNAEFLWPLCLGIASFFLVAGKTIWPTDIAWIFANSDQATHFLGWQFFRNSPWSWPPGASPNYGLEISNSIFYSDSIPLLALIFKPLSPWLPNNFQYIGIWYLLCFMMQAFFSWKLIGLITQQFLLRIVSIGFFVFSPPMIMRMHGHDSLVGHWLVVAALYLCLQPQKKSTAPTWQWSVLAFISALVHSYLLAMVLVLWLADLSKKILCAKPKISVLLAECITVLGMTLLALWLSGFFMLDSGYTGIGFGKYSMNILSPFHPQGWSFVLHDLPLGNLPDGYDDYEGFNFLGIGIIIGIVLAIPHYKKVSSSIYGRKWAPLLLILFSLSVFAISNNIRCGNWSVTYGLPEKLLSIAQVFRASGRMFWPVYYTVLWSVLYVLINGYSARIVPILMILLVSLHIGDTYAGRRHLTITKKQTLDMPLHSDFWALAATRYKKIRLVPAGNAKQEWKVFSYYAASHGMATDAVYLARVDTDKLAKLRSESTSILNNGGWASDTLYILENNYLTPALTYQPTHDLLARVDGFNVLAPRWKLLVKETNL